MQSVTEMSPPPKLQPPGAGLPLAQRVVLKLWFGPFVSRYTPPSESRKSYEAITRKLVDRVSDIPAETRKIKILVDPIPGLEDSSRYWSLNELLEHLLIVSKGVEKTILSLASGVVPEGKADIAKLKPGKAEGDFLNEFTAYAPGLMKQIDERLKQPGMDFNSSFRFRHPWFGPFTARQWYWILGSHQAIHYRQAKEIMSGLKR